MQHIKCVVVGDGNVGKTCLLICYSTNNFKDEYVPTIFDNYKTMMILDGKHIELGLWDTAGQETYERLRPLSYPQTDVFLVCFAVDNRDSWDNVKHQWIPEISHHCPDTPFILVGTKADKRQEENNSRQNGACKGNAFVTFKEGQELAHTLHAVSYVECSAKLHKGITTVFEEAVKAVIMPVYSQRRRNKICDLI